MLFAKETYVRFRNDGVALCKIGGIIIMSGEEKDVPFGNISTMSVANGYRNGVKLLGLVVDGNLSRLCDSSCAIPEKISPFEIPAPVAEPEIAPETDAAPEPESIPEPVVTVEEVVEAPARRGRKPKA